MNRLRFYKLNINDGINELDYLDNTLVNFSLRYEPEYYQVADGDSMRYDNISFQFYNTPIYWWIICLVNNITNTFASLETGTVLKVPNILDIYDFVKKYKKR